MKFVYQQMAAFLSLIAVLMITCGIMFFHLANQTTYQTTWTQLEGYARNISTQAMSLTVKNNKTTVKLDKTKISTIENLFSSQKVHFTIYTSRTSVVYPTNGYHYKLSAKEWNLLKKGQVIRRKNDIGGKRIITKSAAKRLLSSAATKSSASSTDSHLIAKTGSDLVPPKPKANSAPTSSSSSVVPKPPLTENTTVQTQEVTDVFVPVFSAKGKLVAVISVGSMVTNLNMSFQMIRHNLGYTLLLSLLLGLILSWLLAHYIARRIALLRQAIKEVANGSLDFHIESTSRDEIGQLAYDFNQMVASLLQSRAEIKRQEERRRQFFNDAAHEMRTPLTTINGLLEGLAYDAIPEESKAKSIELMRNETKRLIRLVNDNLDYEKIRTGQIELQKSHFNAVKVLSNISAQLQKKAAAANDTIKIDAAKDVPVFADYDRFIQIIFNITQNAIQFTKNGTITLKAYRGNFETIVRISDTGIGMSQDQLKNIWERYYKADPSRKNTKYGESGLGLSIVHQLMQLHEGKIEVVSKQGQGTTFVLHFPDENTQADE